MVEKTGRGVETQFIADNIQPRTACVIFAGETKSVTLLFIFGSKHG